MQYVVIDKRMRNKEKEYLKKLGLNIIEIDYHPEVYDEISSHVDIFICKIRDEIFLSTNITEIQLPNLVIGESKVLGKYPFDIKYNVANIGDYVIHNFKYTDKKILNYIENNKLKKVDVKQGYTKCNIVVTSQNSCITSDKSISKKLIENGIDSLYVNESNIKLLDKSGEPTNMKGFIGGATGIIENKFILFGDSKYLDNRETILNHIQKHGLELVEFKDELIYDYGGILLV